MSYIIDQSLIPEEDVEDVEQQTQVIQREADDVDQTNLTFTQFAQTTFTIDIPQREILIAISKYEKETLKELSQNLQINLISGTNHIIVQTEKDQKEAKTLEYQLQQYFYSFKSVQLDFDIDSKRSIQVSNLLIYELSKQKMYLIRIKSLDNLISLYLVSSDKKLQLYAHNLERRLRGVRIFFQDCAAYMTRFHKNKDQKDCLTVLRQAHYQKTLRQSIDDSFPNIIFHDIMDKKHCFSSLILGLNFPYHLQGKRDVCQKIFRYLSSSILQWFIIFIQFNENQENIRQANLLVNLTNDAKGKNFLCSSQVFLNVRSVAIIGHPKDLIQIIESHLVPNKDKFDQQFVQSIGVLEKNFSYMVGDARVSYEAIEKLLKSKQQIELSSVDQFKQITIKEKNSFMSYCNLLKFILEQKYKLTTFQTEKRLQEELEYVQGKLIQYDKGQNFFDSLQIEIDSQDQNSGKNFQQSYENRNNGNQFSQQKEKAQATQKQEYKQPHNQNRGNNRNNQQLPQKPQSEQNNNRQPGRGNDRNGNHPRSQRIQENQQSDRQSQAQSQKSTEDYNDDNSNQDDDQNQNEQNGIQLIAQKQPQQQQDLEKVEFDAPIVNHMKENNMYVVSQEYKQYFKKILQEEINLSMSYDSEKYFQQISGFICLEKKQIFKLKCFSKTLKIFVKEQDAHLYSIQEKNTEVIQVLINKEAEKVNALEQEEEQYNTYYELTQDNQIYPLKLIEKQS